MQKFTPSDILEITKQENQLKLFLKQKNEKRRFSPKQETIQNILNYSKAISIRKSKNIDFFEFILN
jgi:cell division protein FtsI/penicillin-binding protein 2